MAGPTPHFENYRRPNISFGPSITCKYTRSPERLGEPFTGDIHQNFHFDVDDVQNATWYAHNIYVKPDSDERKHHELTYGPLEKFGYKDFIPMFTASRFNPDEWGELFKNAGARFAGPVSDTWLMMRLYASRMTRLPFPRQVQRLFQPIHY